MKKRIQQQQSIDMKPIIYDEKEIETMLLQEEANILKSLPTNLLIVFNNLMEQVVWRFAFVTVTTHVMLLIPVLRYVKLTLEMSIIPYIYIFPMLFIFPFIIYGLWDTNITTISYIDELLLSFLKNQQNLAKINLEEQNNKFLLNDITPESVKYFAYVRLFTRISPDVLRDEILALKQKASGKKLTILSTSTESNIDIESFPMNSNNNNNMNVVNAAQTIIKVVSATGQDQKDTLNELKELQQMLSNINKKQEEK
jgi:TusA-related sulfurtransferase